MQGITPPPFAPSGATIQNPDSGALLKQQLEQFEYLKGYNFSGTPQHRGQLEELFRQATLLKGNPKFATNVNAVISRTARLYAMTYYDDHGFATARILNIFVLNHLLTFIGLNYEQSIPPNQFQTLKEWENACLADTAKEKSRLIELHFITTFKGDINAYVGEYHELRWMLASTLRWYGESCLESPGCASEYKNKLLKYVFQTSIRLLKGLAGCKFETEYLELLNTTMLLFPLQKLNGKETQRDLEEIFKKFQADVLLKYKSPALDAKFLFQVCITHIRYRNIELAFQASANIIEIYRNNPGIETPKIMANAAYAYADLLICLTGKFPEKYGPEYFAKIPQFLEVVTAYMAEETAKGNESILFPKCKLPLAKWEYLNGNRQRAIEITHQAINTLNTMLQTWSPAKLERDNAVRLLQYFESATG